MLFEFYYLKIKCIIGEEKKEKSELLKSIYTHLDFYKIKYIITFFILFNYIFILFLQNKLNFNQISNQIINNK